MTHIYMKFTNLDVCTINASKFRNGGTSIKATKYKNQIYTQLQKYIQDMDNFRAAFEAIPDKNKELYLTVDILVPRSDFRTKEGSISIKSIDLDNYLKLLIDSVMDSRHHNETRAKLDFVVQKLNINDKYITRITASKRENPNLSAKPKTKDITFLLKIV